MFKQPILLLAILAVSSAALAQGRVEVELDRIVPEGARVEMHLIQYGPFECENVDACDFTTTVNVQITPCPPGLACDGGSSLVSWEDGTPPPTVDLAPSTFYTFDASYESTAYGWNNGGNKCEVVVCEGGGELTGDTFDVPALVTPHWNANIVGSQDGLHVVEFVPTVNDLPNCGSGGECYTAWHTLTISPCPPGQSCTDDVYETEVPDPTDDGVPPTSSTVLLAPDVAYSIGGYFIKYEFQSDIYGTQCYEIIDRCSEIFEPVEFLAGAVPNDPTSWGALKAKF